MVSSTVVTAANRFSLEGKCNTALKVTILLWKDRITGNYHAELNGCILFRGDDKALMINAIKTYHENDWCGMFLKKKAA